MFKGDYMNAQCNVFYLLDFSNIEVKQMMVENIVTITPLLNVIHTVQTRLMYHACVCISKFFCNSRVVMSSFPSDLIVGRPCRVLEMWEYSGLRAAYVTSR